MVAVLEGSTVFDSSLGRQPQPEPPVLRAPPAAHLRTFNFGDSGFGNCPGAVGRVLLAQVATVRAVNTWGIGVSGSKSRNQRQRTGARAHSKTTLN